MFTIMTTCKKCNVASPCLEKDMKKVTVFMEDGHQLYLTQWVCPKCGFVHTAQIDDDRTNKLFDTFRLRMSRFRRNNAMGKSVSVSDVNAMDALQKELDDARAALNVRYDGSVYQLGEQKFKLELCPPDAKFSGEKESINV